MERWTPWDPAPAPPGRYEMIEAVYDKRLGSGRPELALDFGAPGCGLRAVYPNSAEVLRICRSAARPLPAGEAPSQEGLAYRVEDSDFLAWILDENNGTGYAQGLLHQAYRAANDSVDVLSRWPPGFERTAAPPPPPAERPRLAPAPPPPPAPARPPANVWRAWAPAPFPQDHYELMGIRWRGGRLDVVLESLRTKIAISHASALAMRTCDEMMRLKGQGGDEQLCATLFYRVEDSDFSAWAGAGLVGEGGRRAVHYAYLAHNDDIDVLAFDPPSVSVSPAPPEEARG